MRKSVRLWLGIQLKTDELAKTPVRAGACQISRLSSTRSGRSSPDCGAVVHSTLSVPGFSSFLKWAQAPAQRLPLDSTANVAIATTADDRSGLRVRGKEAAQP